MTVEFIKPCKSKYQRVNYHFGVNDNRPQKFEIGDKLSGIARIFDSNEEGCSCFSMEVVKYSDEIAFENYYNIPKDSYKII